MTLGLTNSVWARPEKYLDLLKYVQQSPNQGETNTCWFMASTGAMELLLNQKHDIKKPKRNGPYDLSESFLIWQNDFYDAADPQEHFIEEVIARFNHGEAILNKHWRYDAMYWNGRPDYRVWNAHPQMDTLPRIKVPQIKSELLFARGKKWDTFVLEESDVEKVKTVLWEKKAPIIINYNDDGFWHVVLIVGYDDQKQGVCYEIEKKDCKKGSFVVRDSDGMRYQYRAYNWFLQKANAAAVVELK